MFLWPIVPQINQNPHKTLTTQKSATKKKLGYGNWWLFRKEGTAAEPWPTAEELWNDPEVKQAIKAHNESVRQKKLDHKINVGFS